MSDTPRTESFIATCGDYEKWPDYRYRLHNFARSLERENDALIHDNARLLESLNAESKERCRLEDENAALAAAPTLPTQEPGLREVSGPEEVAELAAQSAERFKVMFTPPVQEVDYHGEDLTKFYIVRKPGLVPRVCRPMGDDLAANLRDWFKHHPGATIDIVRVRLIDGRVSDLWVDDGIEYLQILDDGEWIPERPYASTPSAQKDEPVAYQYLSYVANDKWLECDVDQIAALQKNGYEVRPLYTRPQSDNLRKAAEEAADLLEGLHRATGCSGSTEKLYAENLRTALAK